MALANKSVRLFQLFLVAAALASSYYLYTWYQRHVAARLALLPQTVTAADGAGFRNRAGIEFVRIPAGRFLMGSPQGVSDELPQHEVIFAQPFYLGRYEVTLLQWEKIMGGRPNQNEADDLPVEQITWEEAQQFVRQLNALQDGYTYRLPSEAEWEYAARAGTTGDYVPEIDNRAWHRDNARNYTQRVGQKKPNDFGLYDILGNVWELCDDQATADYRATPHDGSAYATLEAGPDAPRSIRGHAAGTPSSKMRVAFRGSIQPTKRNEHIGLRLAASLRKE